MSGIIIDRVGEDFDLEANPQATTTLPAGHWTCEHVAKGADIAAVCATCDKDLCEKCIGAHTVLRHEVKEAEQ